MPYASVLPVQPTEERNPRRGGPSGLAMPIFSFSLSSLEPKSLRMVILTIMLVQVLCCHLITKITRNGINGAMFVTDVYKQAHNQEKEIKVLSLSSNRKQLRYGDRSNIFGRFPNGMDKIMS